MKALQYRKVARSSALVALFSTRTETSSITGLPEALAAFVTQLDLVETLAERQAQPLVVVFSDRDRAFADLQTAALAISGQVYAYAIRTGRESLALNVHLKGGDLDRVRYIERVRSSQRVHDAIAEVLATIPESGVTAPMLVGLQTKIDRARSFVTAPRSTVVDKATATAQLAEAIRDLDAILKKQIDPLLAPCEVTHRELWLQYRAARKAIAAPGASSAEDAEDATTTAATTASSAAAASAASTSAAGTPVSAAPVTPMAAAA
eukprot:gene35794-46449_t